MKIYIDTCCYGRPFDDHAIPNTKTEAEAVCGIVEILKQCSGVTIFGSGAIEDEIDDIGDDENDTRDKVVTFYGNTINKRLAPKADIVLRAREFMKLPMKEYDSYHLAYAEAAKVDYLITTDKKFVKKAARLCDAVNVINPKELLPEVKTWL